MARGVNKVILIGNIGQDPETIHTQTGATITKISVATSESWKDKQTGEKVERSEWHRVVFFGKLAEIAGQYLKKGAKVYIEGALRTSKYQKEGVDHYSTDIIASEMQMLDSRVQGDAPQSNYQSPAPQQPATQQPVQPSQPSQQQVAHQQHAARQALQQQPQTSNPYGDDFDDDIPF